MNRKILILIVTVLSPIALFSQVNINGQIKDKNNKSIELIEIQLKNKDSIIVKSELTNSDGKFIIATEKGEYLLLIKQMGKFIYKQPINIIQNIDLGIIRVNENEQKLLEVVITSKNKIIERKVDRLIFNVENSVSVTGGDAIDALRLTPGLQVENDEIAMIGKGSMAVMIDDRLVQLSGDDLMNFLKTIQSDNIKSIEVIKAPPAKYDAGGNGGIVNIKLKKVNKDDLFRASINSSYEQKTYATGSIGGNITSQINKLSIYSAINYKNGSYKVTENKKYHYPAQLWDENNLRREYTKILSGRIGFDYKQNDKNEYGVLYLGSLNKPSNNEIDKTDIYDNQNQLTDYFTKTDSNRDKDEIFNSYNAHYKRTIDTLGKSITANVDYLFTNQGTNRTFDINSFVNDNNANYNAFTTGNQNIKISTSNIDVELPYAKIKYTFGAKVSFINTNNDFKYYDISTGDFVLDTNQSNEFNYTENTQALYFITEKKINKWEFQIGLRAENTQTKGYSKNLNQTNTNNYLKLFPTVYSSYTANEKNVFSFNYYRRVGRPSYYMANPFRTYTSDFSYTEGNPFIQPEFSTNVELAHTYDNNLNTSFSYSYLEDGKSQIQLLDPTTNISKSTFLNFFKVYSYSLDVSYTLKRWKWLESNNSASLFYRKTVANELLDNQIVEQLSYYVSSNNTFFLNDSKTFLSSLELTYKSPQTINIYHISETFNTNIGFKYIFSSKNLQFSLNFYDVFKTNRYRSYNYSNSVLLKSNNYYDVQTLRFSLLYKFGNKKINVKENKRGNENESNRAN
ncbi:outer membrane beta-barrel family protein [Flavobacterium piscis]|uniref:Outer membrane protein beta-barrel domain-containing protein n=1 Tax=Flavobacterium piscis TaxID=1114874 RepID=A0ABU1YC74_9FLAO|nr:outer membrane beta-barrel family protein [Flavobacterium piscis]MDR7211845.1 hypothetical protein [Flavobacterium piscis]